MLISPPASPIDEKIRKNESKIIDLDSVPLLRKLIGAYLFIIILVCTYPQINGEENEGKEEKKWESNTRSIYINKDNWIAVAVVGWEN